MTRGAGSHRPEEAYVRSGTMLEHEVSRHRREHPRTRGAANRSPSSLPEEELS
jgi:hypothetical protein